MTIYTDATAPTPESVSTGQDIADAINKAAVQLNSTPTAAGRVMDKLIRGCWDVNILVNSDSTGDANNEWVYMLAEWYAANFPAYSVNYVLWDKNNDIYFDPEVIQTGTGVYTLTIYNFAIAGTTPEYIQGHRFEAACAAIPACDLFIVNHGHNIYLDSGWGQARINETCCVFLSMVSQVLTLHSGAGVILNLQNPRQDNDKMNYIFTAVTQCASLIDADLADSAGKFESLGKSTDLYAPGDNIHPNSAGEALILEAMTELHFSTRPKAAFSPLDSPVVNLLENGDFSAFDGALPDGFGASDNNNSLVTKDTAVVGSRKGYSVKILS